MHRRPQQEADELCTDLAGTAVVAEVLRWDEATSRFVVHPCGTGTEDFPLAVGMAYGVRNAVGQAVDGLIVGSHDAAFTLSLAATSGSSLSWVSAPYHAAIPDLAGTPGVVDAEDLCRAIGEGTVFAVVRWDEGSAVLGEKAQPAVFLLKAKHGGDHVPPACSGVFNDVACPGGFAVNWIEELAAEGVTAGCGGVNIARTIPCQGCQWPSS